jgi:BarA-like signal transduction histidine kinase
VEDLVHQRVNKVSMNRKELDNVYPQRNAVENTNNVLKQIELEDIHVRGWHAVKSQTYLILILRLAIAITRYCNDQHCNLRKISIGD